MGRTGTGEDGAGGDEVDDGVRRRWDAGQAVRLQQVRAVGLAVVDELNIRVATHLRQELGQDVLRVRRQQT